MMMLSACTMRALVGIDVAEDGSGTFEVTMAFDEELRTLLEQESEDPIDWSDPSSFDDTDTGIIDDLPEGASVSAYSEGDFEGFTMSAEFADLGELNEILTETGDGGEEAFPIMVTSEGDTFELSSSGPLFDDTGMSEEDTEFLPEEVLSDLFDMQLRVRLPGEVVSTNADETTDDGVMVWQLDPMASEPLLPDAVTQATGSSLVPVIIGVVMAGLLVALIAFFLLRNRRAGEERADEADETPEPAPPLG